MTAEHESNPGRRITDFAVINAFHALMDGRKVRVYPGTGREVDPANLGSEVKWVGDSIGCGGLETVDLVDQSGNWASVPANGVQVHAVWDRIDAYGQKRIAAGLAFRRKP